MNRGWGGVRYWEGDRGEPGDGVCGGRGQRFISQSSSNLGPPDFKHQHKERNDILKAMGLLVESTSDDPVGEHICPS